mgnify:CR=1 FL=1
MELVGSETIKPWEVDAALKPKRLILLAQVAVEARNRAFAEANREQGDTNWGLGCKAHERFCHALSKLAEGAESPWLRVRREGLSFNILVEDVPVRVYRGSALKPPMRHVRAMANEARVLAERQLPLFVDAIEPRTWFWMMAMETWEDGRVRRSVFFQVAEDGRSRHHWEPPTEGLVSELLPADPPPPPPKRSASRRAKASNAQVTVAPKMVQSALLLM